MALKPLLESLDERERERKHQLNTGKTGENWSG